MILVWYVMEHETAAELLCLLLGPIAQWYSCIYLWLEAKQRSFISV
jgi:hypothetical protein